MKRAEKKAMQARGAVRTLAQMAAKNAVKNHIRAQGWKLWDFTSADLTRWAEVWLAEHPEIWAQARVRAVELGFAQPITGERNARDTRRSDEALPAPNRNAGVAASGEAHEARSARASLPNIAPR
jgi:hypothetical protein